MAVSRWRGIVPPLLRYCPRDSVVGGCRSSMTSNSRPPVPSFFCCWCVGVPVPCGDYGIPCAVSVSCFYKLIYRWKYPSPLYCLILKHIRDRASLAKQELCKQASRDVWLCVHRMHTSKLFPEHIRGRASLAKQELCKHASRDV